jgi:murein DD-endopeptidase
MTVTPRALALEFLGSLLWQPYRWGGDDPIHGIDCSGAMILVLRSVGRLPPRGDWTAHQLLHEVFASRPRLRPPAKPEPGMLVFWPRGDGHIRHVEMAYAELTDGTVISIGASGGGSSTTTLEAAARQNAFVQPHPIPPGWIAAIDPF